MVSKISNVVVELGAVELGFVLRTGIAGFSCCCFGLRHFGGSLFECSPLLDWRSRLCRRCRLLAKADRAGSRAKFEPVCCPKHGSAKLGCLYCSTRLRDGVVCVECLGANELHVLRPYAPVRWLGALVPVIGFVVYLAVQLVQRNRTAIRLRHAAQLVAEGREVDAIERYEAMLADPAKAPAVASYLAVLYTKRRRFADALEVVTSHITSNAEVSRLMRYTWQSRLYRELDQKATADDFLAKMKAEFPNQAIVRIHEVRRLRDDNQHEQADQWAQQALDDYDTNVLQFSGDRDELESWLKLTTNEADDRQFCELFGSEKSPARTRKYGW